MSILLVVVLLASCDISAEKPKENETGNEQQDDGDCEHTWGDFQFLNNPTCGTDEVGTIRSVCQKCGKVRDMEWHPYVKHSLVTTEQKAVCGQGGKVMKECKNCNYREEYETEALVHDYRISPSATEIGTYALSCIHCGEFVKNVTEIRYEDYGAAGDGIADDAAAIRKAHEDANTYGLNVVGNPNATYRIGPLDKPIPIRTNTDWNGAHFIFDDHQIKWYDSARRFINVFEVQSDKASYTVEVPEGMQLSKGQTNVGLTFAEPCIIKIENSGEKIYLRYGENANGGVNKAEMILVDANGNVDPSTPIQYDYSTVTKITVYSLNETPVSVGNCTITTIAPNPKEYDPGYENNYCYYARGILVTRSNTTVHDIKHIVENEDMTIEIDRNGDGVIDKWGADKSYGVPYHGFFNFQRCYNAAMVDCFVEGHQAYCFFQDLDGNQVRNEMGSYDINATDCIGLQFIRITQYENEATGEVITNRFMYHGIMGSNFCRNVVMDGCYLDRFDSHQGLHNARITNSTLGFGILVIGGGELYIENVTRISGGTFVHLRGDYNSVFDGDVIIKNCKMKEAVDTVINGTWRSFYNGLPNYVVRNIVIDGLETESNVIYIYNISGAVKSAVNDPVNKLYLPESIKVSGVVRSDSVIGTVVVKASKNNDAFSTVTVTRE